MNTKHKLKNFVILNLQIDLTNLFSNIEEIYAVNVSFWLSTLKPVMNMVGRNNISKSNFLDYYNYILPPFRILKLGFLVLAYIYFVTSDTIAVKKR